MSSSNFTNYTSQLRDKVNSLHSMVRALKEQIIEIEIAHSLSLSDLRKTVSASINPDSILGLDLELNQPQIKNIESKDIQKFLANIFKLK